jgi:hypothetical protein
MEKTPEDKAPIVEEEPRHRSKRKKRETACADKRRSYYGYCGLCGSGNIINQGVNWCDCGAETEYLNQNGDYFYFWERPKKRSCGCSWEVPSGHIGVKKCLDCGAVKGPKCPVCKRECWNNIKGQKYCSCGYRKD